MQTINNHKTKIMAIGVALFVLALVFVGLNIKASKAQACDTDCLPNLSGYCVVDKSQAQIGEKVTFSAHGTGGSGSYAYIWTGDDGLSANTISVSKSYNTAGTKSATVRIVSNGQSVYKTCNVVIKAKPVSDLGGYCEGRPSNPDQDEKVTWTAYPTGGNGNYSYSWSGTDGLDGNGKTTSMSYDDPGTKTATVRITSDGQSITRSCTVKVQKKDDKDIDAYCEAFPRTAKVGERVTFKAYPSGSTSSNYKYSWDGDDNLDGNDKEISHTYSTPGTKDAEVRVTLKDNDGFDRDEVTAKCHVTIIQDSVIYVPPTQNGVYLDTIPATGVSPSVKTALFMSGMLIWSSFLGYIYIRRRNLKFAEQQMIEDAMKG